MRRQTKPNHIGLPEHIEDSLQGPSPTLSIAFNPYGTLLAAGCTDGSITIWNWDTRTAVRTWAGGHDSEVTSLLWSANGRQLLTACCNGRLVLWDVLQGTHIFRLQLSAAGITNVQPQVPAPIDLRQSMLLVSFSNSPPQCVSLKTLSQTGFLNRLKTNQTFATNSACSGPALQQSQDGKHQLTQGCSEIPAFAMESEARGAQLVTGAAAASTGPKAIFAPAGNAIISAARGVLAVLRWPQCDVIDVIKLQGVPQVTGLELDPDRKRLLVSTNDKQIRIYALELTGIDGLDAREGVESNTQSGCHGDQEEEARGSMQQQEQRHQKQPPSNCVKIEELNKRMGALKPPREGSLVDSNAPRLRLIRRFTADLERASWGPCCFSPDGRHVVSALASEQEHVMYTWNVPHGYAENVLQGGKDGIAMLTWHPDVAPMQLLAVGRSGKVYIWAKILSQDWSVFAPDFETLTNNRLHMESETEFDIEPPNFQPPSIDAVGDVCMSDAVPIVIDEGENDDEIDIGTWELPCTAGRKHAAESDDPAPLLYLPVLWSKEGITDSPRDRKGGAKPTK